MVCLAELCLLSSDGMSSLLLSCVLLFVVVFSGVVCQCVCLLVCCLGCLGLMVRVAGVIVCVCLSWVSDAICCSLCC